MDWSQFPKSSNIVDERQRVPWDALWRSLGIESGRNPIDVLKELSIVVRNPLTPFWDLMPEKYGRPQNPMTPSDMPLARQAGYEDILQPYLEHNKMLRPIEQKDGPGGLLNNATLRQLLSSGQSGLLGSPK